MKSENKVNDPLGDTTCSLSSVCGAPYRNHIFCFVMSVVGNEASVRSYAVGDYLSRQCNMSSIEGQEGILADLMRTRHPGIDIVDLVVEYAVQEPFQEVAS